MFIKSYERLFGISYIHESRLNQLFEPSLFKMSVVKALVMPLSFITTKLMQITGIDRNCQDGWW